MSVDYSMAGKLESLIKSTLRGMVVLFEEEQLGNEEEQASGSGASGDLSIKANQSKRFVGVFHGNVY